MCVAAYAQHVFFLFSFFLVVVKGIIIITAWHAAVSSLKRLWLVAFLKKKKNLFTITRQDVILMVCKGGGNTQVASDAQAHLLLLYLYNHKKTSPSSSYIYILTFFFVILAFGCDEIVMISQICRRECSTHRMWLYIKSTTAATCRVSYSSGRCIIIFKEMLHSATSCTQHSSLFNISTRYV